MKTPARLAALALTLGGVACSSAPTPNAAPSPSRAVRVLDADDPDLLPISLAAGAGLKAWSSGNPITFRGVSIEGRALRAITDSLIRNLGLTRYEEGGMTTISVTKAGAPPGVQSVAGSNAILGPSVYAFSMFRATADSAYIGGSIGITSVGVGTRGKSFCIALSKSNGAWTPVRNADITRAQDCGR